MQRDVCLLSPLQIPYNIQTNAHSRNIKMFHSLIQFLFLYFTKCLNSDRIQHELIFYIQKVSGLKKLQFGCCKITHHKWA